jgi:hypothetical protein
VNAGASRTPLTSAQKQRIGVITAVSVALFVVVRLLPTGTNLSHMDFRVQGTNVIEFCDPANPQFLPVVAVRSPVTFTVTPRSTARTGEDVEATLSLATFSGKAIAPEDLQLVQTRKIHLLIVDPSLDDYQHVHPEPGRTPGSWTFVFHPRFGGLYRIFADFTPVATNRGLYAEADMEVAGAPNPVAAGTQATSWTSEAGGYAFDLAPASLPLRAGVPVRLTLSVHRPGGGVVPLLPVMDAFMHLVAFDVQRSGFAHIHPEQTDVTQRPDPEHPAFTFRVMIPAPGRYVIWSQVNLGGRETFAPFWFDVAK